MRLSLQPSAISEILLTEVEQLWAGETPGWVSDCSCVHCVVHPHRSNYDLDSPLNAWGSGNLKAHSLGRGPKGLIRFWYCNKKQIFKNYDLKNLESFDSNEFLLSMNKANVTHT